MMKKSYLFSHKFRLIGWIMFPFFFIGSFLCWYSGAPWTGDMSVFALINGTVGCDFFEIIVNDVFHEVSTIGLTISLLFIGFSKEKNEDEFISYIRTKSLVWAIIVSYIVFILGTIFIYDMKYLAFLLMIVFLPLFIFIIKYNWEKYKLRRDRHE